MDRPQPNAQHNAPLADLSPNLVILPPQRQLPAGLTNPLNPMMAKYHDVVAIDIALLPNADITKFLVEGVNARIRQFGSFPLDVSHFCHMSIVHTIVPRDSIPQICHDLQEVCQNFNEYVSSWQKSVQNDQNPLYSIETCGSDQSPRSTSRLLPIPHCNNSASNREIKSKPNPRLHTFLSQCPTRQYFPLSNNPHDNRQGEQRSVKKHQYLSYSSLLASNYNSTTSQHVSEHQKEQGERDEQNPPTQPQKSQSHLQPPTHFDWTVISPGPLWAGDTTLPYVGYPNPSIFDHTMNTNGLNLRVFHDLLTLLIHPHRISIWEAKAKPMDADRADRIGAEQIDMKAVQTNGCDDDLFAIAQALYFTGDTIVPVERVSEQIETHQQPEIVQVPVYSLSNHSTNSPDSTISVLSSPDSYQSIPQASTVQFYTTPNAFDREPADVSTLKYTNAFDECYMGDNYNPHITIGSGDPVQVRNFILDQIPLADDADLNAKAQRLKNPIRMNLNECTVGVFQLGLNGSCRFPIFKTYFIQK